MIIKVTASVEGEGGLTLKIYEIECEDLLDGLQKLHEKLNDVAMPRLKKPPTGGGMGFDPNPRMCSNDPGFDPGGTPFCGDFHISC